MDCFLFPKKNISMNLFEILELLGERCRVNSRQYFLLKVCVS